MRFKSKCSQSAFAVICAPVLSHTELTDAKKILYGHIANLSNEYGYCYATNAYLANLISKSIPTIKRAIKKLMDLQFIEIYHVLNGKQDERRITLSQLQNINEEKQEGGSKMSSPQLTNELSGGSKMSHRIIKEERINNKTTTNEEFLHSKNSENPLKRSCFFKCKNKVEKLEKLEISQNQKQKIYCNFEEKSILNGLEWLENVGERENTGAALYDAIKNGYKPKLNKEKLALENKKYAQEKLYKFNEKTMKGYKMSLCRQYVEFSSPNDASKYFEYCCLSFKDGLSSFCHKLGIEI